MHILMLKARLVVPSYELRSLVNKGNGENKEVNERSVTSNDLRTYNRSTYLDASIQYKQSTNEGKANNDQKFKSIQLPIK
jgi:hypothetical protein